jgi:uncharacterized protein YqiB (DUF1249 family)
MRKNIYETNYERLATLNIFQEEQEIPAYRKSTATGYMDLSVERLPHMDSATGQQGIALSLAHYFEQNGDLCCDPDMVILIHPQLKMVEALTFQQANPPIYHEVYPAPHKFYKSLKQQLNSFLRQWLINLNNQGHGKQWTHNP